MNLKDSFRNAPVVKKGDYDYVIHPLLDGVPRMDPAWLEEWVDWAAPQSCLDEATVLLAPEAMALPLAGVLSVDTLIPYIVARKRSYGLEGEFSVKTTTGYGASELFVNDLSPEDTIVIVDDVLSTGGTLGPLLEALKERNFNVAGVLIAVDKGSQKRILQDKYGVKIQAMLEL